MMIVLWRQKQANWSCGAAILCFQQFVDIEEEFLHAAEFGDIHNVKRIINEFMELNVDCIDALGRTALRLAVKNEHLEVSFCSSL